MCLVARNHTQSYQNIQSVTPNAMLSMIQPKAIVEDYQSFVNPLLPELLILLSSEGASFHSSACYIPFPPQNRSNTSQC